MGNKGSQGQPNGTPHRKLGLPGVNLTFHSKNDKERNGFFGVTIYKQYFDIMKQDIFWIPNE